MNQTKVGAPNGDWALAIDLQACAATGPLLSVDASGAPVLRLCMDGDALRLSVHTYIGRNPRFPGQTSLEFALTASPGAKLLRIEWLGSRLKLYADGALADEEWPLGALAGDTWTLAQADGTRAEWCQPDCGDAEREVQFTGPMQFFSPPGHNTGVGDCMPFGRDGRYCLYYLFDRRAHQSKAGLGAHQWAQISSSDLKTWTLHPMALGITEQWEGSICTGSLIQREGLTYAFYAVRMSDGSPARLTWATSRDGVRFDKSGQYFALRQPYEPVSARDPMVFLGADGQYHMLVTTSLVDAGRYGGCLAHLTSPNLRDWTQLGPFIVPGFADQPECSDYFEWNGWYYLVFSNFATARYRMSRQPFGPWMKPECEHLDAIENQVPKTAAFGDRRLLTGFLARYPRTYAGNAVTHELIQREDGTLGAQFVPEILPAASGGPLRIQDRHIECAEGRAEAKLAHGLSGFRLRAKLRATDKRAVFGLSIQAREGEYRVDFDMNAGIVSALRPGQYFQMGDARNQLHGVRLDGDVDIDLVMHGDILDMVVNGRALTMRLGGAVDDACLCAYVKDGALILTEIELTPLA